jgi:RNA polymerase sigma-70 factor (ECF subfamily)
LKGRRDGAAGFFQFFFASSADLKFLWDPSHFWKKVAVCIDLSVRAALSMNAEQHPPDVLQWVRDAQKGDRGAFRAWLLATHRVVFAVAHRSLKNKEGAEDVVQETYLRAWQNLGKLKEPAAHLGWLCRIARNVAADRMRHKSRREEAVLDAPVGDGWTRLVETLSTEGPNPEDELLTSENKRRVALTVNELKEKYRVVLLLREVDGMSYDEMAQALGVPRGTVESRLHRAREHLAKKLKAKAKREKSI